VAAIQKIIYGEIGGIKNYYLEQLELLYDFKVAQGQLISQELIAELVRLTSILNVELGVYLNRRGQVAGVAAGDRGKVSLPDLSSRRGEQRLSGLRLIHTHPGSSGHLSEIDVGTLKAMSLDAMVAIGVKEGIFQDLWVGFINAAGDLKAGLLYGPLGIQEAVNFNYLEVVREIEAELAKQEPPLYDETVERALAVGVELRKQVKGILTAEESLAELKELAMAAGAQVIDSFLQTRERPDNALYIGRGLAEELAFIIRTKRINLVVFDTELTGVQMRNLEGVLNCKILDRTGLILDIFAQRARSREGKIQVELAQLNYLLPRLTGFGTELSRLAGGIGTRGPGETKLEKDRRHIQRRISDLEKQLEQVSRQRQVTKGKRDVPLVSLVGYTNAGKSTLRYKLLELASPSTVDFGKEDPGANHLFATLDSTIRGILLPTGQEILVADTVGFIQKLPHQLVSAFKATLEEVREADLLLHVVDVSHPQFMEQMQAVEDVLAELGVLDKPLILVFNKLDLLTEGKGVFLYPGHPYVEVSAKTGAGIEKLLGLLAKELSQTGQQMKLLLPHDEGQLLGMLYKDAQVLAVNYLEEGILVEAFVPGGLKHLVAAHEIGR